MIDIRRAAQTDLQAVAEIKAAVWPEEKIDLEVIGGVLCSPAHFTLLAEAEGEAAGFVDAFPSLSEDGRRRFEIDLLAVHPARRRQGIARLLVEACAVEARQAGCDLARALIKTDNVASQGVFAACGYQSVEPVCDLYISREPGYEEIEPDGLYLVQVETINYAGFWMESSFDRRSFLAARRRLADAKLELVGALLPSGLEDCAQAALSAGFQPVGQYRWWLERLSG